MVEHPAANSAAIASASPDFNVADLIRFLSPLPKRREKARNGIAVAGPGARYR
jgi:hypothetical protein